MTATEFARLPREVPEWHDDGAACRLFPELVDAWHDARTGSAQHVACRLICAACPVRMQCATDALERGEPHGMWGGLDRRDRREVARAFGYPAPTVLPEHGTNARYAKHGCPCAECREAHAVYEGNRRWRARVREQAAPDPVSAPVSPSGGAKLGRGHDWGWYRRRVRRRGRRR